MNYDSVAWLWITVAPRVPHRARRERLLVMWASQNVETEKGAALSDPLQCHILFHLDTAHPLPSPLWLVWRKKAAAKEAMQKGEEPWGMEAAAVLRLCSETGPRNLLFLPIRALLFQQLPTGQIHGCSARQPASPSSHPPAGWQSIMPQIPPAVFLLVFIHLCKGCRRLFSRKKKEKLIPIFTWGLFATWTPVQNKMLAYKEELRKAAASEKDNGGNVLRLGHQHVALTCSSLKENKCMALLLPQTSSLGEILKDIKVNVDLHSQAVLRDYWWFLFC